MGKLFLLLMLEKIKRNRMEKSKIFIGIGVLLTLVMGLFFVFSPKKKKISKETESDVEIYKKAIQEMKTDSGGFQDEVIKTSSSMFDDGNMLTYDQIIELASKGKLDLVSELWTLRNKCGKEMTNSKCNAMIEVFLNSNYPPPGNKHLAEIFSRYLEYEDYMRSTSISSDLSEKEKYDLVQKYRRKFFSEKDAKLIFGYEEARTDYSEKVGSFFENSKNENFEVRKKEYEKFRKDSLGDYYDTVVSNESSFDKYQTELSLKSNDFSKLSDSSKKDQVKQMRISYFGKDANARLEKVDEEIRQRDLKYAELKKEEDKFLSENSSLSDSDKQKKISEIREKVLGKEEAEGYTRIESINNYKP